jgi:C1q domain-containing protein
MATTRPVGYVITASVWNSVLSRLSDNGLTFSGNFAGGTIVGTTATLTGTLTTAVIQPDGNGTRNLGASGFRWNNIYGVTGNFNGTLGVGTSVAVSMVNVSANAATAEAADYAQGVQVTVPNINGSQGFAVVRQGIWPWSIGFAYNSTVFAIGVGKTVESSFTEANAYLTIQTGGQVQGPAQPGFLAFNSASDAGVVHGATVIFNSEVYDVGDVYTAASGIFTAPVAGKYHLGCNVDLNNTSGSASALGAVLVTTTRRYLVGYATTVANGVEQSSGRSIVVDMVAGDTAYIEVISSAGTCTVIGAPGTAGSNCASWFSGRLLL